MNAAHAHLLVNHVSLFCLVIGSAVLIFSMVRKSADLRMVASTLFVVAGLFAMTAFWTGEGAEEVVKTLGEDNHALIEQHEQAAEWAQRSGILVAVLAIALEWASRKKRNWAKYFQWTLLFFALHGCTVFMATALLGGKIRHSEIR